MITSHLSTSKEDGQAEQSSKRRSETMPERVHQVQAGLRVSDSRSLTDFRIAASSDIWAPSTNLCAPSTKWCAPGSSTDRWTLQVQTRPWPGHQRCNWRLSPRAQVIYVLVWKTQRAARDPKIGQRVAIYIGCHISRFYKYTFRQFHWMMLIKEELMQGRRTRRSLCHGHSLITQREKLITRREKQSHFKHKVGKYEGMQEQENLRGVNDELMRTHVAEFCKKEH